MITQRTHPARRLYARPVEPGRTMLCAATPGAPGRETTGVPHDAHNARFQSIVLSSLDAAHNLAWWLTRDEHEAADVVQEACLKAWRFFNDYRGGDGKSWLLSIVRTTVVSRARRRPRGMVSVDAAEPEAPVVAQSDEPVAHLLRDLDRRVIGEALALLPDAFREVLVLREIEGLSYAQIGTVVGVPVGTVMSRLSRARDAARDALRARLAKG